MSHKCCTHNKYCTHKGATGVSWQTICKTKIHTNTENTQKDKEKEKGVSFSFLQEKHNWIFFAPALLPGRSLVGGATGDTHHDAEYAGMDSHNIAPGTVTLWSSKCDTRITLWIHCEVTSVKFTMNFVVWPTWDNLCADVPEACFTGSWHGYCALVGPGIPPRGSPNDLLPYTHAGYIPANTWRWWDCSL
jgi:hypothetical protein